MFLLIFGLPLVFQILVMISIFSKIGSQTEPDTTLPIGFIIVYPIIMLVFAAVQFGWFWSVAVGLQRFIPEELRLKVKRFKFALLTPVAYAVVLTAFIAVSIGLDGPDPMAFAVIIPLHLFSMFCIFYSLYFVAKTVKTAELQRKVTFGDFVGEFFLIWFFPIGVWIVQPKINELLKEQ